MSGLRERMKDKKRIVLKIGSSSLTHKETVDMLRSHCGREECSKFKRYQTGRSGGTGQEY